MRYLLVTYGSLWIPNSAPKAKVWMEEKLTRQNPGTFLKATHQTHFAAVVKSSASKTYPSKKINETNAPCPNGSFSPWCLAGFPFETFVAWSAQKVYIISRFLWPWKKKRQKIRQPQSTPSQNKRPPFTSLPPLSYLLASQKISKPSQTHPNTPELLP